jgi:anti-sigma B factor antagonist
MEINVRTEQGITVVALAGELTAKTAPDVEARVLEAVQPGGKVVLDLRKVSFMASAGARLLLRLSRTVGSRGGRAVLVGVSPEITNTLMIIGFWDFFVHHDSLEAGIAALGA